MQQSGVANHNKTLTSPGIRWIQEDTSTNKIVQISNRGRGKNCHYATASQLPSLVGTSLMHLGSDTQRILPFLVLLVASKPRGVILCTARRVWRLFIKWHCTATCTARLFHYSDIAQQLLFNNWQLHTPIILDHCLSRSVHDVSSLCLRSRTWIRLNQSWSVWIIFPFKILWWFLLSGSQRLTLTATSHVCHVRSPSIIGNGLLVSKCRSFCRWKAGKKKKVQNPRHQTIYVFQRVHKCNSPV